MKLVPVVASLMFVAVLSGCGSSSSTPAAHKAAAIPTVSSSSSSAQSSASTSAGTGFCQYLNGATLQLQNLKKLGSNPSADTLTADLQKLQTQIKKAEGSASATVKPYFKAVDAADGALQQGISQLKNAGAPASSYAKPVKAGVAGLATAFDELKAFDKCA